MTWQTLMWTAWAATFLGLIVTWFRVRGIAAHQQHHCRVGISQHLALAHLLATLDGAGIVLPEPLRDIAAAFRAGEDDAVQRLLADLDDRANALDLDDVEIDEDRHADDDEGGRR
jgi:hypothetical protein